MRNETRTPDDSLLKVSLCFFICFSLFENTIVYLEQHWGSMPKPIKRSGHERIVPFRSHQKAILEAILGSNVEASWALLAALGSAMLFLYLIVN